jgi:kumamolisin
MLPNTRVPAIPETQHTYGRLITVITPLLTLTFVISFVSFQLLQFSFAKAIGDRPLTPFQNAFVPAVTYSHMLGHANPQQRITLSLGLQPRHQQLLAQLAQNEQLHTNITTLNAAQNIAQFYPDTQTYNKLRQFLQQSDFIITQVYTHRLLIEFNGTIKQVEKTFHVTINMYEDKDKNNFYANSAAPILPPQFARDILSINGLNNAPHWSHASLTIPHPHNAEQQHHNPCPAVDPHAISPGQFTGAYQLNDLYRAHYQGEEQTVALFELSAYNAGDLTAYQNCFGRSTTTIQTISTMNSQTAASHKTDATAIDAELVLSTAPRLRALMIYETTNDDRSYLAQWAQIIQDAPPVVSTSWTQCETTATPQTIWEENALFQIAALQKQSIIAASGNNGSEYCSRDSVSPANMLTVSDPAAQPFVTGVGGTSLTRQGVRYEQETAWNNTIASSNIITNITNGGASGGGISHYWSMPDWQHMAGVPDTRYSSSHPCQQNAGQHTAYCREVPDVSLHADPQTGYWIYCSVPSTCNPTHPWIKAGGTATAAPLWAAFIALSNEMSQHQGGTTLGFINPLLYTIANDPLKYVASFHDITSGDNDYQQNRQGEYPATVGYDMVTGLGSYKALALATYLTELMPHQTLHH